MSKPLLIAASIALAFSISACGRDDNRAQQGNTGSGATANTGVSPSTSSGPLQTGEAGTPSSSTATDVGGTTGSAGGSAGMGASGGMSSGTPGSTGTDAAAGAGGSGAGGGTTGGAAGTNYGTSSSSSTTR